LTTRWFAVAWEREDVWPRSASASRWPSGPPRSRSCSARWPRPRSRERPSRPRRDLAAVHLPIALPGILTGIALRSAYHTLEIPFSFWTIVIGHANLLRRRVFNNAVARLRRLQPNLIEASMDLGAELPDRAPRRPAAARLGLAGGRAAGVRAVFDEVIVTTFTAASRPRCRSGCCRS